MHYLCNRFTQNRAILLHIAVLLVVQELARFRSVQVFVPSRICPYPYKLDVTGSSKTRLSTTTKCNYYTK